MADKPAEADEAQAYEANDAEADEAGAEADDADDADEPMSGRGRRAEEACDAEIAKADEAFCPIANNNQLGGGAIGVDFAIVARLRIVKPTRLMSR